MGRAARAATVIASVGLLGASLTGAATGPAAPPAAKAPGNPVYFVHGWGDGKDCDDTWGNMVEHFAEKGWDHQQMHNLRYYKGDEHNCVVPDPEDSSERVKISDADIRDEAEPEDGEGGRDWGSKETRIYNVAKAFANRVYDEHTSKGEAVEIVAHSMGGLVTRVALLGSAQGWEGFPRDAYDRPVQLQVPNVVTLGTPHQGVIQKYYQENEDGEDKEPTDTQWKSMNPDSEFMRVLHAPENRLSQEWALSTDWSFVGSNEDDTVTGESAIDKDFYAHHKYLYRGGNKLEVTHQTIRTETGGDHHFNLQHWHSRGEDEGGPHRTEEGRSPVALAYRAVTDLDR